MFKYIKDDAHILNKEQYNKSIKLFVLEKFGVIFFENNYLCKKLLVHKYLISL